MNNKIIKEHASKSNLIGYVDHETPRHYFINGNADIEEVQNFAELIIRECAKVADDNYDKGFRPVGLDILEHFGIEQ